MVAIAVIASKIRLRSHLVAAVKTIWRFCGLSDQEALASRLRFVLGKAAAALWYSIGRSARWAVGAMVAA
jgi:hypothetical protein